MRLWKIGPQTIGSGADCWALEIFGSRGGMVAFLDDVEVQVSIFRELVLMYDDEDDGDDDEPAVPFHQ